MKFAAICVLLAVTLCLADLAGHRLSHQIAGETGEVPGFEFKAPIYPVCFTIFLGKEGSRGFVSGSDSRDSFRLNRTVTFSGGYVGNTSKVDVRYLGHDKEADVYSLQRQFPVETSPSSFTRATVRYYGKKLVVFSDEHQVIELGPTPAEHRKSRQSNGRSSVSQF